MTQWNNIVQLTKDFIRAIIPETGTTTNSYVDGIDIDTRWLGECIITIANTAAVNELDYQVLVYNDYGSGTGYITTTNTVTVSDSDQIILARHARVKVQMKSTLGDNHTTYQIDAIGGR